MTKKRIIRIGDVFGRLSIKKELPVSVSERGNRRRMFLCECECGNKKRIALSHLTCGKIKSCGCYHKEVVGELLKTHGLTKTREYNTWQNMKKRCLDEGNKNYNLYGGRGITICNRWMSSFGNFLEDMGERPRDKSLDRIDGNKGYCKENCRWATHKEQQSNKSNNVLLKFEGKIKTVAQWAEDVGINRYTLYSRISAGWGTEKALTLNPYIGRNNH